VDRDRRSWPCPPCFHNELDEDVQLVQSLNHVRFHGRHETGWRTVRLRPRDLAEMISWLQLLGATRRGDLLIDRQQVAPCVERGLDLIDELAAEVLATLLDLGDGDSVVARPPGKSLLGEIGGFAETTQLETELLFQERNAALGLAGHRMFPSRSMSRLSGRAR